jgi:hydroxymethylpyrimidine/phosphomethylpyrimidine kinase
VVGRDRRARREWAILKANAQLRKLSRARRPTKPIAVALTIAGSDSSAGAGIQADLKTFSALGVYGLTAVTCVVAETPGKVSRIEPVSAAIVREQIEVLFASFPISAIKTGLLCSAEIILAVARAIAGVARNAGKKIPLLVDPVMIATSGDQLLDTGAVELYETQLFPLATLITPNLDEAAHLLGGKIKDQRSMEKAAKTLAQKYSASILLKGGHLSGGKATDVLFHRGKITKFAAPFVRGVATHGTGCTYSAAITAGLANGLSLEASIRRAKKFVTAAIRQHFRWQKGSGRTIYALNHSSGGASA